MMVDMVNANANKSAGVTPLSPAADQKSGQAAQTPAARSIKGVKEWRFVSKTGVAPICANYECRGWWIQYCYYYINMVDTKTFYPIILSSPKNKKYTFWSKEELEKFLAKKKLPSFFGVV